ncbi:MAG: hypothetical protein ACRDOI_44300 [Trebonia sp.]
MRLALSGSGQLVPGRWALSLPAGRHSHSLARLAALEAARGSFDGAHDAIARRCGPVIGKRQIEESVVEAAGDIPAFYAARVPEPCTPETLLVLSADGKGVVMRPEALREATAKAAARTGKMRTRLAAGEKPNRKRMAALVTVYDAEPATRRPHDVIAPPGGRHGSRALPPGPTARAKWLAGSVRQAPRGHDRRRVQRSRGSRPRPPADLGRPGRREHQLALIQAEAARRHVTVHVVIDIIHVLERIWGAAWALHATGDPAAEDWVAARALAVLVGDSGPTATQITAEADAAGLEGSQRTGADACVRYLRTKHEFLRYDQAWTPAGPSRPASSREPAATSDRLDITGARWGLNGAEAILSGTTPAPASGTTLSA